MTTSKKAHAARKALGQSMVEYALGLGCVAGLCMVALGSLGHISGDMIRAVEQAINYGGSTSQHAGWVVNTSATPWVLN